ncbi:hypothetical protein PR202_gb20298 [Eleusine coracana subsp. coracana]|uniref:Uncharacterized protein n=1 Tax=Eleusine coracana subsp. coracana TaxID=191504 RepID=A0AAV5F9Y0_ELECO|nr:hypothetical protein PR202_gb20298 [Eleusine coracana subsp. coracana]
MGDHGFEELSHDAWRYTTSLHHRGIPTLLWDLLYLLGYDEPPSYKGCEIRRHGVTLAEVLAAALNRQQNDSEILHRLVDIMSHLAGHGGHRNNNNQPRQSTYSNFLSTHPPTFERAREPLDADHWLRQTETKFGLLECTEHQKVLFAAQQLQGSASVLWANYEASLPAGRRVEWNDFKTAFCAHFIPAGLMQRNSRNSWI